MPDVRRLIAGVRRNPGEVQRKTTHVRRKVKYDLYSFKQKVVMYGFFVWDNKGFIMWKKNTFKQETNQAAERHI